MQRTKPVTLLDIGRDVGKSVMAVSAVINGTKSNVRVSENTRQRIRDAAKRLGYRTNAIGRGLVNRRMNLIGVIAEIDQSGQLGADRHKLFDGIISGCSASNLKAIIYPISDWQTAEPNMMDYCDGVVDGFILLGPHLSTLTSEQLFEAAPFVAVQNVDTSFIGPNIDVDVVKGAFDITQLLVSFGHRRIAYVAPIMHSSNSDKCLQGYQKALSDSGMDYNPGLIFPGGTTRDCGMHAAWAMLSTFHADDMPTAIFCANDALAHGAIDALRSRDVSVPADISVAGFGDDTSLSTLRMWLTSVRLPLHSIGMAAVSHLASLINERAGIQPPSILANGFNSLTHSSDFARVRQSGNSLMFEPTLMVRESVASVRSR